ncbi:hypothetical protein E2C01_048746 [Portunus trituberculatus]|uniref:Uncharacterized protein n=1 Tax=Portunus trituberculatus TaxID=210409 RepID=A0A5B7G3W6_PORTR|nr:hypothetical protein [Portunus trituberculatus]
MSILLNKRCGLCTKPEGPPPMTDWLDDSSTCILILSWTLLVSLWSATMLKVDLTRPLLFEGFTDANLLLLPCLALLDCLATYTVRKFHC